MKAWISGFGWVSPAGCGMGRANPGGPFCSGTLEIPTRKQVFSQPHRRFGRLDEFSRVGLAGVTFCLRDAGEEEWTEKRLLGIIAASRYGCLATDLAYLDTMLPDGGKLASPNLFAYSLPNCFLGEAALTLGLTGNHLVLNEADDSGLSALRFAMEELAWSDQPGVVAGICDLPPRLAAQEEEFFGSLFMLLSREPGRGDDPYGTLELKGRDLLIDGVVVTHLPELVSRCLRKA